MKFVSRFLTTIFATIALCFTASVWAEQMGVVDMQAIFQTAPQVVKINDGLTKEFQSRKDAIMKMSEELKANVDKYQKNKAVMSEKDIADLKAQVEDQQSKLSQEQGKFQQDVFQAQNQKMSQFLEQVKDIIKNIASEKKLDMVLPKNTVLYSQGDSDITPDVLKKLRS